MSSINRESIFIFEKFPMIKLTNEQLAPSFRAIRNLTGIDSKYGLGTQIKKTLKFEGPMMETNTLPFPQTSYYHDFLIKFHE